MKEFIMAFIVTFICILIMGINILGYQLVVQRLDTLAAGQKQIAGFLTVPGSKLTGPIGIFYDVGEAIPEREHKFRKGMPKKKDRKGTK